MQLSIRDSTFFFDKFVVNLKEVTKVTACYISLCQHFAMEV